MWLSTFFATSIAFLGILMFFEEEAAQTKTFKLPRSILDPGKRHGIANNTRKKVLDQRRQRNIPTNLGKHQKNKGLPTQLLTSTFHMATTSSQLATKLEQYLTVVLRNLAGSVDKTRLQDTVIITGKNNVLKDRKYFTVTDGYISNLFPVISNHLNPLRVKTASGDKWAHLNVELSGQLEGLGVKLVVQEHSPKHTTFNYDKSLGKNTTFEMKGVVRLNETCRFKPLNTSYKLPLEGRFCTHCNAGENAEVMSGVSEMIARAITSFTLNIMDVAMNATACHAIKKKHGQYRSNGMKNEDDVE